MADAVKILGIDPGSAATGYALLEVAGERMRLIECGTLRPSRHGTFGERLAELGDSLESLLATGLPDEAAVENLFHAVNAGSSLKLAHARGVLLCVLARRGLPIAEYTPLQVKKAVSGYGLADKDSLGALVERLLAVPRGTLSRDASDAAAVALCHAQAAPMRNAVAAAEATSTHRIARARRAGGAEARRFSP